MHGLLQLLNLWDNPVFHRFRRSQLRLKKSVFWYLVTLIITTFVISLIYILQTNGIDELSAEDAARTVQNAARNLWLPLLIIQGLILLLKGTGRTSSGLIQDKIDQTLDYQRLTPLAPLRNIVGYLFGLPILEYSMFALTIPHLAFIIVKGNIPLATVFSVYLVFFTCAIFYHMTAIAVGMVMKRWIWGYLLSIFAVAFLNLILAPAGSELGLKFMQYLSVFPVIGQKVVPLMTVAQFFRGPNGGEVFSFADPVPFFDGTISPFLFTLLLQSMLIVTFATMAVRRWEKADKHSLSKPYALGALIVFIVLVTGNLWPIITGQYLPFPLFGITSLDFVPDFVWIALPLVYSCAIWLLCTFLFFITVPTHHAYVRGLRRAAKLNRKMALPWDDDSASIPFMSLFVIAALVGFWAIYQQMFASGLLSFLDGTDFASWRLPLALGAVLIYTLLLLQVLEYRGAVLTFLLVWLLPILVAIVSSAAVEDVTRFQSVIASLSPFALILMSGLLPLETVVPADSSDEFGVFLTGAQTGLFFVAFQIVLLSIRWRQLRRTLH
jgi:hypothetical protein